MVKSTILLGFLGMIAAGAASAGDMIVAEFRADENAISEHPNRSANPDSDLYSPGNLYTREIGGSEERAWLLGDAYALSGVMDWGYQTNYLAGAHYSNEQYVTLGSRMYLGDNSETFVYHGYGRELAGPDSDLYGESGDAESTRTGLAQTLYFADQQAQIGVGYEYATGDREQVYQGLEGHEVNLRGEVDIGWGFSAHLEAAYGLYSYTEYDGVYGDLTSSRKNMRAGISRSFTPSLSWGLHYSYIDEEFGLSELSQSRQTWGLNLKYRY